MSRLRKAWEWVLFLLCPVGVIMACLLWASPVQAQPSSNIIANTVQTTNTGATSMLVGCAIGSTTCTGTLSAGVVTANALGAEAGYVEIQSNVPASTTFRLYNSSGTLFWNGSAVAIGGSISGTTNNIPVFTSSSSLGNSIMTQSGTTITVANTLSATTLTGLLSTANQSNVTGLGTVTTGTWNATKIGLLYGGTNADLSGTGGTSQFLRQASVGAAITVVRPAVADLSDNTNIFLLNANNTVTATGVQTFGPGGTGANSTVNINGANAAGAGGVIGFQKNGTSFALVGMESGIVGSGTSSNLELDAGSALGIDFMTNGGVQRWGINSAGDFTFGASSHIADSSGTPTGTASSCGPGSSTTPTVNGTDYAFTVSHGAAGADTTCAVTFGHTWSSAPICIAVEDNLTAVAPINRVTTGTTTMSVFFTSTSSATTWNVLCRGF